MSRPSPSREGEELTDAEMVQRVRRWLSSTKERDIDRRWLLRTCTIAEKALQTPRSETGVKPLGYVVQFCGTSATRNPTPAE